jgi:hypothetical protein
VTKIIPLTFVNLVTPKAGHLFNKPASENIKNDIYKTFFLARFKQLSPQPSRKY